MTTCIKCGKEIPDGELFCAECGLNPGAAEARPRPSVPAQPGRMQTPVRRAEPLRPAEQRPPEPAAKPEKKEKRPGRALTVCACIVAAVSLGLAIWQFSGLARQRRAIRLREDDLAEREKRLTTLETQIDDLTAELAAEEEKTAAQTRQIETLLATVDSAESSASSSRRLRGRGGTYRLSAPGAANQDRRKFHRRSSFLGIAAHIVIRFRY